MVVHVEEVHQLEGERHETERADEQHEGEGIHADPLVAAETCER